MTNYEDNEYFASVDEEHIIDKIREKITLFYTDLSNEGIMDLVQRLHKAYYGGDSERSAEDGLFASSKVKEDGKLGYLKKYKANHFRNLVRHRIQLATSQRLDFQPEASNTDYKTLAQTTLAKGLLDYYIKDKRLEKKFKNVLEKSEIFMEGWIHAPWDETLGESVFGDIGGEDVKQGDIRVDTYHMLDVVRDITNETDDHKWLVLRTTENKYDLAATFPTVSDEILGYDENETESYDGYESYRNNFRSTEESGDQIEVWIFYHLPTPAMPNGRLVKFTGDTVLIDAPMPYKSIPLFCVKASNIEGTPYGYSEAADLLGPQKALDIVNTQNATNMFNTGLINIWSKPGQTPRISDLTEGLSLYQSAEKPEVLELAKLNAGTEKLRDQYERDGELISGINSTVRGNPPGANMSGAAQALLVSQAVSFNSMLEASYIEMVENVATLLVQNIQSFAKTPRIIKIVGKSNKASMQEFVADDIADITRVTVATSNPLARTVSGRIELARLMQEMGITLTPYQLNNIIETGSLSSATEGTQNEYLTIRAENAALREGRLVKALISDNHPEHIKEHLTVIADPDSRLDEQLVMRTLGHVQEHMELWKAMPPEMSQILGIPPAQQTPPPPAGPPANMPMGEQEQPQPNQPNLPNLPAEAPPEATEDFEQRTLQT